MLLTWSVGMALPVCGRGPSCADPTLEKPGHAVVQGAGRVHVEVQGEYPHGRGRPVRAVQLRRTKESREVADTEGPASGGEGWCGLCAVGRRDVTRLEGGQREPARTKRAASRRRGPGRSVCADALPLTRGSDGDLIGRLPFTHHGRPWQGDPPQCTPTAYALARYFSS